MVSIIGYAMIQNNKHLPGEIYREIMSFLVPKFLLDTKEIKNYNKVVADIPGFGMDITLRRIFPNCLDSQSFHTVKFIYRLERKWKNITRPYDRNTIKVHLPHVEKIVSILPDNYTEQYNIYHLLQSSAYQRETRTKHHLQKAKYG